MEIDERKSLNIEVEKNYSDFRSSESSLQETTNLKGISKIIKHAIKTGILGFFIVFSLILFTKVLAFTSNLNHQFIITQQDFVFSFWGFMCLSLIYGINSLKK